MLKKVPLHNPSDLSCAQDKNNFCSMCKSTGKSIFYVCTSGRHVICNNCQCNALNEIVDDGDYVPEKECAPNSKKEVLNNHSGFTRRDMSSGDHSRCLEPSISVSNSNNTMIKDELLPASMTKRCSKCEPEMKIIYQNEKFDYHRSNATWNHNLSSYKTTEEPNYEITARPVVCPIASCSKIVTIDSFSQHFNFDHSKVPKMVLNKCTKEEFFVSYATLSEELNCVATFVVSLGKRSSHTTLRRITSHTNIHNFNKNSDLLLLMVVKMKTKPTQFCIPKYNSRNITNRSYALLDDITKQNMKDQSSINKSQSENKIHINKSVNEDDGEIVLLWLCRLTDKTTIYTINVMREDNHLGYSYIGDAVHIRKEQDPISIYNSTECLSLRGTAIKKLLTPKNELKVLISTLQ